jgi:hypothetical protein
MWVESVPKSFDPDKALFAECNPLPRSGVTLNDLAWCAEYYKGSEHAHIPVPAHVLVTMFDEMSNLWEIVNDLESLEDDPPTAVAELITRARTTIYASIDAHKLPIAPDLPEDDEA